MGMYASAEVFYGYILDEEIMEQFVDENGDEIEEFDLAEKILKNRGVVDPWDSYPDTDGMDYATQNAVNKLWHAEHTEELDEWYKAKAEIDRRIKVEMSSFGHYDESRRCLIVKGTAHHASPSYPLPLDTDMWTDPHWIDELDSFLEIYGIEPPEDGPCWWLVASYG